MALRLSLTITDGPEKGKTFEFEKGSYLVGRNKGDISLSDKKASGNHCRFIVEDSGVWLEDLNSTNGTFLGSKKIDGKIELSNLDVVTVGLSRFSVAIVEALDDFKKANTRTPPAQDIQNDATARSPVPDLPPEDAVYRETGVQRIEGLIDDELKAFSKWDHPAVAEPQEAGVVSVPKITVILSARKAPEGITRLICSSTETSLGRKGVDIRLNDLDLSRKHCAIEIVGGTRAYVRDLASTNGTYVNGSRISYQELKEGDLIQIGQSIFEVNIHQEDK